MIQLFDQAHEGLRGLLASGAPVYLTVNPVEFHGPHLSLHNDRLVSEALARGLHARLSRVHPEWPFLCGPDLEVGVEPCPGVGSRHTRYAVARGLVREACRALADLGAQRVVLLTFHGAPLHALAIDEGVRLLRARGVRALAPFNLVMREMLELDPDRFAEAFATVPEASRAEVRAALQLDFHAGFFETSMALHCAPASVSPVHRELPPCAPIRPSAPLQAASRFARRLGWTLLAEELRFAAVGVGWNALRPFPGYTGSPHLASAEAGRVFYEAILDRFEPAAEAVFAGRAESPAPILRWVRPLTLGGRLGPAAPPHATSP